ncbi:MAG TPA: sigma-70 family RNA polymerase sigma factor [Planctomycetota bacterium]
MAADQREYLKRFLSAESSLRGYILAHVRELDVAEDLLQQTALVLWQKFAQYDPARPFLAWALGIARLEILNAAKRGRPGRSLVEGDLDRLIVGEYLRLESELPRRRQLLRHCLKHLPASMVETVRLRYEHGTRLDQIASRLGKSLAAVKVTLHRARLALQDCVRMKVST